MLPRRFQDIAAIIELEPASWRQLFDATAWPAGLSGATLTHEEILSGLTNAPTLAETLLEALEVIDVLGNEGGRDAVLEGAVDQNVSLTGWPQVDAPRELASRLFLDARTDDRLNAVLVRARLRVQDNPIARRPREFAGKVARHPRSLKTDDIREAVSAWCAANQRGDDAIVFQCDRDGQIRFEILHGHLKQRVLELRSGKPSLRDIHPAHADHISYDPATGRLTVATRSSTLLSFYRELFGKLIADDPGFFASENICTLASLQTHGREPLARARGGVIQDGDLVELLWDQGGSELRWMRSNDCFKALASQSAPRSQGKFKEAKIRIAIAGRRRAAIATIKVPNVITIRGAGAAEEDVHAYLARAGIKAPDRDAEDGPEDDLWTLFPWQQPEERWRRMLGKDFDHLKKGGVLAPIILDAVSHPDHKAHGDVLQGVSIGSGIEYGVSHDEDVPSRTLTQTDMAGFALVVDRLHRQIREALRLQGPVSEVADGLWCIGRRTLGSANVSIVLCGREPPQNFGTLVKVTANGTLPVIIVPQGRSLGLGVPEICCSLPAGPYDRIAGEIARQLGLLEELNPAEWVASGTRLVILKTKRQMLVDGLVIDGVAPDTYPWKFALAVAEARGKVVSKSDLHKALSKTADDGVVKTAKSDFMKAVKQTFKAARREEPEPIFASSRGEGYALACGFEIV